MSTNPEAFWGGHWSRPTASAARESVFGISRFGVSGPCCNDRGGVLPPIGHPRLHALHPLLHALAGHSGDRKGARFAVAAFQPVPKGAEGQGACLAHEPSGPRLQRWEAKARGTHDPGAPEARLSGAAGQGSSTSSGVNRVFDPGWSSGIPAFAGMTDRNTERQCSGGLQAGMCPPKGGLYAEHTSRLGWLWRNASGAHRRLARLRSPGLLVNIPV